MRNWSVGRDEAVFLRHWEIILSCKSVEVQPFGGRGVMARGREVGTAPFQQSQL